MITIRYINELKLGNISDEDIPTFCYESSSCNLDKLELGLFKGTFLLRMHNTILSEDRYSIVFITDVSLNLHWAIISIKSKTWPRYEEKMQCGYNWHDPGHTAFDCLCSHSSKTYLRITLQLHMLTGSCIQARLTLSDKESWDKRDGVFDYRHFYESVVRLFENNPGLPWVEETLKWWNA